MCWLNYLIFEIWGLQVIYVLIASSFSRFSHWFSIILCICYSLLTFYDNYLVASSIRSLRCPPPHQNYLRGQTIDYMLGTKFNELATSVKYENLSYFFLEESDLKIMILPALSPRAKCFPSWSNFKLDIMSSSWTFSVLPLYPKTCVHLYSLPLLLSFIPIFYNNGIKKNFPKSLNGLKRKPLHWVLYDLIEANISIFMFFRKTQKWMKLGLKINFWFHFYQNIYSF